MSQSWVVAQLRKTSHCAHWGNFGNRDEVAAITANEAPSDADALQDFRFAFHDQP